MNTNICVICSVLFLVVQQGTIAAVLHGRGQELKEKLSFPVDLSENSTMAEKTVVSSNFYELDGDPMLAGPQPPFKPQEQDSPGLESQMDPKPDFGYTSYNSTGQKLQGKVAIITGGDSGIGRAVALAFAREGASVVISYLNETEDAEEIQRIIQEEGHECLLIPGDITEEAQCEKIINETVTKFNRIDILVNNAAYQGKAMDESIEGMSHDRVLYTFKTNIIAMFDLTRYAIPYMQKGSSIINVASRQAYHPSAEILDYATTKAAIVGFTKGLAEKMLEKGIRVNCVAPGPVWTPLVVSSYTKDRNAVFGADIPMKRPAQPRELAPAFVFLASAADSSFISGEILAVTGGRITA